jgi:hypothetical protein
MVMRRRRPLLRGAMLAGAGAAVYHAGKRQEADEQQEADDQQVQQPDGTSEGQGAPAQQASGGTVSELERLKDLLDEGALTQDEFDAAKQQVLQGR